MIDPAWLALAAMLGETPLAPDEAQRLAQELGDACEVLPWLLITRRGFAGWPATRAALKEAGKAVIRPRPIAPDALPGAMPEWRAACAAAGLRAIAVSDESDRWAVDEMIRLRQRVTRRPQPNDFIATS